MLALLAALAAAAPYTDPDAGLSIDLPGIEALAPEGDAIGDLRVYVRPFRTDEPPDDRVESNDLRAITPERFGVVSTRLFSYRRRDLADGAYALVVEGEVRTKPGRTPRPIAYAQIWRPDRSYATLAVLLVGPKNVWSLDEDGTLDALLATVRRVEVPGGADVPGRLRAPRDVDPARAAAAVAGYRAACEQGGGAERATACGWYAAAAYWGWNVPVDERAALEACAVAGCVENDLLWDLTTLFPDGDRLLAARPDRLTAVRAATGVYQSALWDRLAEADAHLARGAWSEAGAALADLAGAQKSLGAALVRRHLETPGLLLADRWRDEVVAPSERGHVYVAWRNGRRIAAELPDLAYPGVLGEPLAALHEAFLDAAEARRGRVGPATAAVWARMGDPSRPIEALASAVTPELRFVADGGGSCAGLVDGLFAGVHTGASGEERVVPVRLSTCTYEALGEIRTERVTDAWGTFEAPLLYVAHVLTFQGTAELPGGEVPFSVSVRETERMRTPEPPPLPAALVTRAGEEAVRQLLEEWTPPVELAEAFAARARGAEDPEAALELWIRHVVAGGRSPEAQAELQAAFGTSASEIVALLRRPWAAPRASGAVPSAAP